jgi:hypothetical protein
MLPDREDIYFLPKKKVEVVEASGMIMRVTVRHRKVKR